MRDLYETQGERWIICNSCPVCCAFSIAEWDRHNGLCGKSPTGGIGAAISEEMASSRKQAERLAQLRYQLRAWDAGNRSIYQALALGLTTD